MAVVDVRDVGMPVRAFLVPVLVAVAEDPGDEGQGRVLVFVVPFPVAVPVRVDSLRVDMVVGMAVPEEKAPREAHEDQGDDARDSRDLSEEDRREGEAEKRSRGEEELGA